MVKKAIQPSPNNNCQISYGYLVFFPKLPNLNCRKRIAHKHIRVFSFNFNCYFIDKFFLAYVNCFCIVFSSNNSHPNYYFDLNRKAQVKEKTFSVLINSKC